MPVIESAVARYLAPTTLTQALECLRESDDVTILAGGTDLMPQSKAGRVRLRGTLLNIRRIGELSRIALDGDAIRIGALATITQIGNDPLVRQQLPVLVEACDHFDRDLKYANNSHGSFFTTVVDSTGDVGKFTSIGLDPNGVVSTGRKRSSGPIR